MNEAMDGVTFRELLPAHPQPVGDVLHHTVEADHVVTRWLEQDPHAGDALRAGGVSVTDRGRVLGIVGTAEIRALLRGPDDRSTRTATDYGDVELAGDSSGGPTTLRLRCRVCGAWNTRAHGVPPFGPCVSGGHDLDPVLG